MSEFSNCRLLEKRKPRNISPESLTFPSQKLGKWSVIEIKITVKKCYKDQNIRKLGNFNYKIKKHILQLFFFTVALQYYQLNTKVGATVHVSGSPHCAFNACTWAQAHPHTWFCQISTPHWYLHAALARSSSLLQFSCSLQCCFQLHQEHQLTLPSCLEEQINHFQYFIYKQPVSYFWS